jgi:hypothetical protein
MYRRRMIRLVQQALLDLDLPEQLTNDSALLSRKLQGWGVSLKKEWQRQAAGRMGAVDPLLLLAACVAWRLYEDEYRDSLQTTSGETRVARRRQAPPLQRQTADALDSWRFQPTRVRQPVLTDGRLERCVCLDVERSGTDTS